jgi:hypothetical protein
MVASLEPAVLFRPLGGFNDTLCGLWRCAEYARKFGRLLIIDTYFSGLMTDFGDFFEVDLADIRVELAPQPEILLAYLDAKSVRWPRDAEIPAHDFLVREEYLNALKKLEPIIQKFSTSRAYSERLLIHHASGGGISSHNILTKLRVNEDIRGQLRDFAETLPPNYIGVHIRNSDYKTEYRAFLRSIARRNRADNRFIYVGTDNSAVVEFAARVFPPNRLLRPRSSTAVVPGKPLHDRNSYSHDSQRRKATIDMLVTLFVLAGATSLEFPRVYKTDSKHQISLSGFSLLARFLHENDDAFESFFGLSRPAARQVGNPPSFAETVTTRKMGLYVHVSRLKTKFSDLFTLDTRSTCTSRDIECG